MALVGEGVVEVATLAVPPASPLLMYTTTPKATHTNMDLRVNTK